MLQSKHMDKICIIAAIAAVAIVAVVFACSGLLGIGTANGQTKEYEDKLFDTSEVHTIDIQMSGWDTFIANATSEEYSSCDLVIDGETFSTVGIRGKGNTSLSNVESMDSERYSFKVEFDHYSETSMYYGLDKLSLNNIIQDKTYMKDYLCYRLMAENGVNAPLCSYAYITVNGEDWGLYLAVEGIEDSFLERNYGSASTGDLYKPDSSDMGGGRGNGGDFDNDQDFGAMADEARENNQNMRDANAAAGGGAAGGDPGAVDVGDAAGGMAQGGGTVPEMQGGGDGSGAAGGGMAGGGQEATVPTMPDASSGGMAQGDGTVPEMPDGTADADAFSGGMGNMGSMGGGGAGGGGGMNSQDVCLQYIDDDASSYSNIFDNAKTSPTDAAKSKLI